MRQLYIIAISLFSLSVSAAPTPFVSAKQLTKILLSGQPQDAQTLQSVTRHYRDTNTLYPLPSALTKITRLPGPTVATGGNFIVSPLVMPWKYKYSTTHDGDSLVIHAKIHFKKATERQLEEFKSKIAQAEAIWNTNIPVGQVGFKYRFEFEVVSKAKDAGISVGILPDTRGPFYKNWSENWTENAVAHEIGHMMGLSDEYNEIEAHGGCDPYSLMCNGWVGYPYPYHYYHILRRVIFPGKAK